MAKAWLRRSARQALMYKENLMVRCRFLPVINCPAACVVLSVCCARQVADDVVVVLLYY